MAVIVLRWRDGTGVRTAFAVAAAFVTAAGGCVLSNPAFDLDDDSPSMTSSASASLSQGTTDGGESATASSTSATMTEGSSSDGELCPPEDQVQVFLDGDEDGYGGGEPMSLCPDAVPDGWTAMGGDCDDSDENVSPDAVELCDAKDNNCNGLKDERSPDNDQCALMIDITLADQDCYLGEHMGHYYYACRSPRSPSAANDECKGLAVSAGAKSYHWKIDGQAEQDAVGVLVDKLQEDPSIGLVDAGMLNELKDHEWVADGSQISFGSVAGEPPWMIDQPSYVEEYWTMMFKGTHLWNDIDDLPRPFVCEAVPAG